MTIQLSSNAIVQAGAEALADPALFSQVFLGEDHWQAQTDIMRAVATRPLVAVKACHSSGKTRIAAGATLWWLARFPGDGIVITTAPTWRQVEELLWREIRHLAAKAHWPYPDPTLTGLEIGTKNFALGLSTDDPDKFQGFHGTVLIIIDEATGVPAAIHQAIDGIRAGGKVHVLMLGNPTNPSGPFYDAFYKGNWHRITIDAFDTPNFLGLPGSNGDEREAFLSTFPPRDEDLTPEQVEILDEAPRPYLTTRRWAWEKINDWGIESGIYQARVRARFPTDAEDALFPISWVERAQYLSFPEDQDEVEEFGLDVAGAGRAETVMYGRRGRNISSLRTWRGADPVGSVVHTARNGQMVKVDSVGIGFHFYRRLRVAGVNASAVNVALRAPDKKRYSRLKDQLAWEFRELLKEGQVGGLRDEETRAQLIGMRYGHTPSGQIQLVSKKARGAGASPDRADGLILCYTGNIVGRLTCY